MLNDTMVTLQGRVGGEVTLRNAGDAAVAGFRLASTPRRFQRSSGEWVDGTTQWYSVNAWRTLGEHCAQSLRRGDPVVVHGRLTARTYVNKNDVEVLVHEIEALTVGHDLNRGTSSFSRPASTDGAQTDPVPETNGGPTGADPAAA